MIRVAILVDGGFYRKRAKSLFGEKSAQASAEELENYCKAHLRQGEKTETYLYRIFYYDCPPCDKNIYHPFTQSNVSLKKSPMYEYLYK